MITRRAMPTTASFRIRPWPVAGWGNIGVSILPENEEVLIGSLSDSPQGDQARYTENRTICDWKSAHNEGNGKHVPDAGACAPATILVDERADGVHLSYDKMTSLLAPYGNLDAIAVAPRFRFEDRDHSHRVCGVKALYDYKTMYLGQHGQSAYGPISRLRMGCAGTR
jgi:hypothetical protein